MSENANETTGTAKAKADRQPKNGRRQVCIIADCGRDNSMGSIVRGLCTRCIVKARKVVKDRVKDGTFATETDAWKAFEDMGLALPPTHGGGFGGGEASPFAKALAAKVGNSHAEQAEAPAEKPKKKDRQPAHA